MSNFKLLCISAGNARDRFLPLLLLADESERQVRSYMQQGNLYAFANGADADDAAGVVLAIPIDRDTVELKAVAVNRQLQGLGIGKRMLQMALDDIRAS